MVWLGILCGFGAALAQSAAYVFSRRFVVVPGRTPMQLLVLAHGLMGLIGLAILPAVWDDVVRDLPRYGQSLAGAVGFYLLGQFGLFLALQKTEASRVAPLLGLKVAMVALVWVGLWGETLSLQQWAAVGLSLMAAFVLNRTGGHLPVLVTSVIPLTTLCYALSDVHIIQLVEGLGGDQKSLRHPMLAASLAYIGCGLISMVLLPWFGAAELQAWKDSTPYAAAWFAAMFLFFSALAMIGPVLANIILATRGVLSIGLGFFLARVGMAHLERNVTPATWVRRTAAALLMFTAILLYWV